MNIQKSLVMSAASLFLVSASLADSISFQATAGDLRAAELRSAPDVPLANTHRDTVSFSMAVDRSLHVGDADSFVATSREYRTVVSAKQLQNGVAFRTTGPGAVVALSPLEAVKGAGLSPFDMVVTTPEGRELRGSDGMDQLVDQRAVQATGVPFSNGMVGFRLNRALGDGAFVVRSTKNVPASRYQLLVLDAQGSAELSLSAPVQSLVGQSFEAAGRFSNATPVTLDSATAFLLAPDGERFGAKVAVRGDAYTVTAATTRASSFNDGLWELHVTARDKSGIQRDVKTAFAAAYPTARFNGLIQRADTMFDVGVEVASAGRYEISAVLYGTTGSGLTPVATAATAGWVERGVDTLQLHFDASTIKASGAGAPFVLRSVTLKDQSRMAVLEQVSSTDTF